MRIGILSRNKNLYSTRRLKEAALARGLIDRPRCPTRLADDHVSQPHARLGGVARVAGQHDRRRHAAGLIGVGDVAVTLEQLQGHCRHALDDQMGCGVMGSEYATKGGY